MEMDPSTSVGPSLLPDTLELAFTKIRSQANSTIPAVRRPATLLTAIDATLKSSTASTDEVSSLPPAAYLVALLSTLTQLTTTPGATKEGEKRELLEATLYLLSLLTPHLEPALLRSKSSLLATLNPLFPAFSAHAPAIKSLIAISQSLLSALSLQQFDKDSEARQVFAHVLNIAGDARPKVRRRAQEGITALLSSPPSPATVHPYGLSTAHWILERLEEAVKSAKRGGKKEVVAPVTGKGKKGAAAVMVEDAQGSDESRAMALLTFVKNLGGAWADECTPTLLPILLSTLTLSSPHLTLATLTLLSHLFSASRAADSISANSVQETLEALIEARPKSGESAGSETLMAGWVEGVGEGMVAFARTNPAGALSMTSTLFPTVLPLLASATTAPLRAAIELSLELMIKHCIIDSEIVAALAITAANPDFSALAKPAKKEKKVVATPAVAGEIVLELIETVEKSLTSSRYAAAALPHVLALAKALFLRLRLRPTSSSSVRPVPAATILLSKMLVLVGKMREEDRFEWKREAEGVLDAAIKVCGPEWVLNIMPLGLDEGSNPAKARAWLLPLLKPSITNTRLGHFKEYFVPLSAFLFGKAELARASEKGMEAKVWETLVGQIWSLLSGYCEFPTDLVKAFDTSFVSLLANILYTQPNLRPSIFKSLSTLLTSATTVATSTSPPHLLYEQFGVTPAEGQVSLAHLRAMASNILGVSFNVYGKLPRGEGAFVLSCVGDWMAILTPVELASTYDKIEELLIKALAVPLPKAQKGHGAPKPKSEQPEEEVVPATHALLDILITIIPNARDGVVEKRFFELAMGESVLGSGDQAVQKKGYRILARLAEERDGKVLEGRVGETLERLVENGGNVAQGAKRDRTVLLSALVPLLPSDSLHHIPSLIPEAVLGTKESNERTREAAYELIVGMGRKMGEGGVIQRNKVKGMEDGMAEEAEASMEEFVTMVSAGLAGSSPHMISATITSLSRLIFEFHSSISSETLSELLTTLIIFLSSANREIVRSAVGYVKVAIVSLSAALVEPSLPTLIPALIGWSHEHSNHFKVKIRHILERLIRKFGIDKIEEFVPEEDKKLVQNIRKRQMRSKKKKAANAADEDGDEDMEDAEPAPKPKAGLRSAYDDVLYGSDSDISGSEDDERASGPAVVQNRKTQNKKNKAREEGAFIHEDDDEVLDLLDDKMMSRISAARPSKLGKQPKALDSHFKTDAASGRLDFTEESKKGRMEVEDAAIDSMGAYLEAMRGEDGHTRDAKGKVRFNKTQGKRGRGGEEEDEGLVTEGLKELGVAPGRNKKKYKREAVKIGAEFKAKHAGGDTKKNGMQPYAYVPLQSIAGKGRSSSSKGPKLDITGHGKKGKKSQ